MQRLHLTDAPLQRKSIDDAGEATRDAAVADIAGRGVEGAGVPLPHLEQIQASFGHHDISGVQAHQGAAAATASHELGAKAYAFGNSVAFGGSPDLHTAAHEAAHVVQQRGGVQLKGGIDQPGDDYERHADAVAEAVVAGRSAEGLLDAMSGNGVSSSVVQRKADGATPPSPAELRRMMELYLAGNQTHVWSVVGEHARSVYFPDPHPRLTWTNRKAFVRELLMQLEASIRDFIPLAKLDELLHPSNAARTVGPMLPLRQPSASSPRTVAIDAWSPPLGLAIAQALQIAVVSSLHRLGPRYLAVADSSGSSGEGVINPGALIYSMPIDRYVGAAMCAPRVLTIEPPDGKTATKAKGRATGLRPTKLAWEGARDLHLWNWVRATEPADATAEEVAATLWTVTDHHGETNAAFNAYLLAAAPPLFGIPKKFAITHPDLRRFAPAHALAAEDNVDTELVDIAKSSAGDDIALHQSPAATAAPPNSKAGPAEPPPELGSVLGMLADCDLQLGFVTGEVASWGLADRVAPALAFISRKPHELATADAKTLTDWNRVISGQRDRLFQISGAIHNLASTAKKLGVKDPKAPDATPVREILGLLATAAGTSHFGKTSEAKLQQGLELQAGLNARAVQATERDLEAAHLQLRNTMGPQGASSTGAYAHEVGDLQDRSRRLQTTMINGGEVDTAEVDEVTLRSGELALRERVLGTIHSTFALQEAAMSAKEGIAAHIAMLFSGKFRNLESLCQHIRDSVVPIQSELIATQQNIRDEEQNQVGTAAQKARHRAMRRAVLAKAQATFAKISTDEDLRHFFDEGAKVVQNQQFRTACVNAAALIGVAILAAATGGAAAELAGGMLMEAGGVATVAELSTLARVGITTANVVADTAVNAVGQTAIQGGSLKEAFVENLFMSFASSALFGTIARASAETAKLEGREAMTWAKADTFARKAFVASRELGAITIHTVWGAAIGYVAHRVVGGREPDPMKAREWMLQGASVAIGRRVQKAVAARMPGLERLAKRSAEAKRLVLEAQQLQQLASSVEHSKDAASAVELLDQRTKLLQEEIEAIERIIAKDGDAGGELGKMRTDLEGQIHESGTQAMLETKFHLLGLEELVPGTLWKGSDEQIQHALKEVRAKGGKVSPQDLHSKRWKVEIDGRDIQIQEIANAQTPVDHDKARPRRTADGGAKRASPSRTDLVDDRAPVHETSDGVPDQQVLAHEQVTQKVADASKLQSRRVTLAAPDDKFAAAAKYMLPEAGVTDVVVHGSPDAFHVLHNGNWVALTPNSLRTWLKKQGYRGGPIRLVSCEAGAHGNAIAQSIANGLGVVVKAPTERVWVHQDGSVTIGPDANTNTGTWQTFRPASTPSHATPSSRAAPSDRELSNGTRTENDDTADTAVSGGRQDRRDRNNRVKDQERRLRKDRDGEAFDDPIEDHSADTDRTVPVGMKPQQFARFGDVLHTGFNEIGIHDVTAVIQGSGASNRGHESGRPFDEGRVSDYDVALVSPALLQKAETLGVRLSGPLSIRDIELLGLTDLRDRLSKMTERPVNFQLVRGTDVPHGIRVP